MSENPKDDYIDYFNEIAKSKERLAKILFVVDVGILICLITLWITVLFVLCHFIAKFW